MWFNEDLIFFDGPEEIARQRADSVGNLKPVSGHIPDGIAKAYDEGGKLIGAIRFKNNYAEGSATIYGLKLTFSRGNRNGKAVGILSGNRRQVIS
ncbi:MAG: hypothetical protein LAO21_16325 [Acidobacteriia bacterium]|nr:hypothetical protein [Terriglobia bacterium]